MALYDLQYWEWYFQFSSDNTYPVRDNKRKENENI